MTISLIAAMGSDRTIAVSGDLPWKLPDDMQFFRRTTLDKPVVMGRLTYESMGRPLPRRRNLVLTRDTDLDLPGCEMVHSVDEALAKLEDSAEVMIIGGAQIYSLFLPLAHRQHLTYIDHDFAGDTFYPEFDERQWREVARVEHAKDENHKYPFSIVTLERA